MYTIMAFRLTLSAATPEKGPSSTRGTVSATATMLRAITEPVASWTHHMMPMKPALSPRRETDRPSQSRK